MNDNSDTMCAPEYDEDRKPTVKERSDEAKRVHYSSEDDSDDSDEKREKPTENIPRKKGGFEELERLRREKRLAMNRESARARRKRKKFLMESLESRVEEMNQRNQRLTRANETLRNQVNHLEAELSVSRSTIAVLTQDRSGPSSTLLSRALNPAGALASNTALASSTALASGALATGGITKSNNLASILEGERAALQRQTALSNLSGISAHASASSVDDAAAMNYLQLLSLARNCEGSAQNAIARATGENTVTSQGDLSSLGALRLSGIDDIGRLVSTNSLRGSSVMDAASTSAETAKRAVVASLTANELKQLESRLDKLQGGLGDKFPL